jgi:two-component system LytT family sensor kinase
LNRPLPYSFSKLLLLHTAYWLSFAIIQTIVLHRLQLSWSTAAIDAAVSCTVLGMAVLASILVYRFYQPGNNNRIYRFIFGITITMLCCIVLQSTLKYIFATNIAYLDFLDKSMPVRFIFSLLTIAFITIIYWLLNNVLEQKENEKRKSESEQLMKEAELTKLRQQLQPHFLFNSLNSINALIATKPVEARKMTQQLSDFLRGTLKKDDQLVKLSEELEHLKLYLDIEKVRFGHRLNIEFNIHPESVDYKLPALLLQPIVENAIKFGLYDITDDVKISIATKVNNSLLQIEIKNPFDSETNKTKQGVGFGLSSVQRRLYLLYMRQDLLQTNQAENIFITTLKIPSTL